MNAIAIIIPVRNRKPLTKQILEQLHGQIERELDRNSVQIIVVDDGSTDGTPNMVQSQFPQVHLILGDGTLWWGGAILCGMNDAIQRLNSDYIVWLNDDLQINCDFIENLLKLCNNNNYNDTIVGGIVRDRTYCDWIVYGGLKDRKPISNIDRFNNSETIEVDTLCGNIVVIPRQVCDRVGFLDIKRLPHHGSDYEYIMRAKQQGFKVLLSRQLQAITDFSVDDFIRYMPYWMQWYFQTSFAKRIEVIKGLTQTKSNQNVWVLVNLHSSNFGSQRTPIWKYVFCYFNKLIRLFGLALVPQAKIDCRLQKYLEDWNPPAEIVKQVWQRRQSVSS